MAWRVPSHCALRRPSALANEAFSGFSVRRTPIGSEASGPDATTKSRFQDAEPSHEDVFSDFSKGWSSSL